MKLYEIDEAIRNFRFQIDEESGEILNADELDELELAREKKIEGIACLCKERRASAKALRDEMKNLKARAERDEKSADDLEAWLERILDGEKFTTSRCAITWRKSKRVEILDESLIPDAFFTVKTERSPNKTAIKNAIESGEDIDGAVLATRNNIKVG